MAGLDQVAGCGHRYGRALALCAGFATWAAPLPAQETGQLGDVDAYMAHCLGEAFALENIWELVLTELPRLEHRHIAAQSWGQSMVSVAAEFYVSEATIDAFSDRVLAEIGSSEEAILDRMADLGDVVAAMNASEEQHRTDCALFLDPDTRP